VSSLMRLTGHHVHFATLFTSQALPQHLCAHRHNPCLFLTAASVHMRTNCGCLPADFCAGLNNGCVNRELLNAQNNIQPFHICSPLPEGALCGMEQAQYARYRPVCKQRKCSSE
jgi:hypothetical protein